MTFWYQEKLLNFWNFRLGIVEERGFPLKNFDDSSTHFSQFWHENSFGRHSNTEKKRVERRIGLEFP